MSPARCNPEQIDARMAARRQRMQAEAARLRGRARRRKADSRQRAKLRRLASIGEAVAMQIGKAGRP